MLIRVWQKWEFSGYPIRTRYEIGMFMGDGKKKITKLFHKIQILSKISVSPQCGACPRWSKCAVSDEIRAQTLTTTAVQTNLTQKWELEVRNCTRDNIRNGIHLYRWAKLTGSVEVTWRLFEFRHVRINPIVKVHNIVLLEIRWNIVIGNLDLFLDSSDSTLQQCSKKSGEHHYLKFLDYRERFPLGNSFLSSLTFAAKLLLTRWSIS